MNYYEPCFEYDSFIEDRDLTIWIATLSNGKHVYQDDERPNKEPSSWYRLKKYCDENQVKILDLNLKFRSHIENIGQADGYYFIKSILGSWGTTKNWYYYKVGKLIDQNLIIEKWSVPYLLLQETESINIEEFIEKNLKKTEIINKCLILNTTQNIPKNIVRQLNILQS